jgi:hypothetical protein
MLHFVLRTIRVQDPEVITKSLVFPALFAAGHSYLTFTIRCLTRIEPESIPRDGSARLLMVKRGLVWQIILLMGQMLIEEKIPDFRATGEGSVC